MGNNAGMGKTPRLLAACTLLLAFGACDATPRAAGDDWLTVLEPLPDATVAIPFKVRVKTRDALGAKESGNKHLRIWFDGNQADHQISYGDTAQVNNVPDGEHKMTVSLRNADDSDAGHWVEISLTVGDTPAPGY